MRPRYESREDLAVERVIADSFAERYGLDPVKLSEKKRDSDIDYLFLKNGGLYAVGEIKDRRGWRPEYGTVILGLTKVKALITWSEVMDVPALFIVRVPAGIYFKVMRRSELSQWKVSRAGRTDRGDASDIEACYHIPFGEFACAIS